MRKVRNTHEEHVNHEKWIIPYADLLTLLLAFFVVMYALSSINEGKYKMLAASLTAAFTGTPHTIRPINVGKRPAKARSNAMIPHQQLAAPAYPMRLISPPIPLDQPKSARRVARRHSTSPRQSLDVEDGRLIANNGLERISSEIEKAFAPLIKHHLITVRRKKFWLEMEIKTDILFPSGEAKLSAKAQPVLQDIARILQPFPNPVRVEGYTDNMPINTSEFPSNWELSAARAARVVRLFVRRGVDPKRLGIIGWGQYRPVASNASAKGRNRNRRITVVVLSNGRVPARFYTQRASDSAKTQDSAAGGVKPASAKSATKPDAATINGVTKKTGIAAEHG